MFFIKKRGGSLNLCDVALGGGGGELFIYLGGGGGEGAKAVLTNEEGKKHTKKRERLFTAGKKNHSKDEKGRGSRTVARAKVHKHGQAEEGFACQFRRVVRHRRLEGNIDSEQRRKGKG